jgi:hypothetical protein
VVYTVDSVNDVAVAEVDVDVKLELEVGDDPLVEEDDEVDEVLELVLVLVFVLDVEVEAEVELLVEEDDEEEVVELELDEVEDALQAPVMEGTASGPVPIAMRFVPQSAAFATRRFWLSWS